MTLLDTNYVLRWFLQDVPEEAAIATRLLAESLPNSLGIDRVNLAEVTYVLRVQGYSREQVAGVFGAIYAFPSLRPASAVDAAAIDLFAGSALDFEDCVLAASAAVDGVQVATFDKALKRQIAMRIDSEE